jgi:hypothetical protein
MTGSSRLIVEYAGSWALVAAGARSERPGLLRSFHQRSREDRSWLLTPYRPSETRPGSAGPNSKSESGPGLGSLRLVASAVGVTLDHRRPNHHGVTLTPSSHAVPCRLPAWLHSVLMSAAAVTLPPQLSQFRRRRPKTAADQRLAKDRSPINRLSSRSSAGSPRQRGFIIAAVDALLLDQPAAVEFHAEIVIEAHGVERPGVP